MDVKGSSCSVIHFYLKVFSNCVMDFCFDSELLTLDTHFYAADLKKRIFKLNLLLTLNF